MLETWNEGHEGTDIAESKEYGRRYLELTRKYAALFKPGWRPPWPEGPFSDATSVSITFGATNREAGLRQVENEDGVAPPATFSNRAARAIRPAPGKGRYVYFAVDESFKSTGTTAFTLEAEYFDAAAGNLSVEFGGSDQAAPFGGAYTRASETARLDGSKAWRTARFTLKGARFTNGQNRGADFRLVVEAPQFAVGRVTLSR